MTDAASSPAHATAPARVGFLGPHGTFGEQALRTRPELDAATLVPYDSMPDVLRATAEGHVDVGFVAIENALEGSVNVTVDTLVFEVELFIQREVVISIDMLLLGLPGTQLDQVREVVSMPVATAQCRRYLHESLPSAHERAVDSTAEAARLVSAGGDSSVVAIANHLAADAYGLEILAAGIADHPDNATRFVAVAAGRIPAPTGHDKTTVVVYQHADRPGSLLGILQEFAARSINLTRLESRPTKSGLGNYCFLIDFEGHIADEVVADCLRSIRAEQDDVKFLGSYPAAGAHGAAVRADVREAYRVADGWLAALRAQIS